MCRMFRGNVVLLVSVCLLLITCFQGYSSGNDETIAILLSGTQEQVNQLTSRILSGETDIDSCWLYNDGEFPRSILLIVRGEEKELKLGVDRVSDYFLCLLQIREDLTTKEIVSAVDPVKSEAIQKESKECDVCNSLTYPIKDELRTLLQKYWVERLK